MSELISTIGLLLWETVVKNIEKESVTVVKKFLKKGIDKALEKLPFQKKDLDVIECEIVKADESVLTDKKKFLEFIENNNEIQELMNEVEKREPNINIVIENSYNEVFIEGNNNSITF